MKKMLPERKKSERQEMRSEYHFNYRKARDNRFVRQGHGKTVAVILDPDVASVFHTSKSVNTLLRSVLAAWPH